MSLQRYIKKKQALSMGYASQKVFTDEEENILSMRVFIDMCCIQLRADNKRNKKNCVHVSKKI